ncbi:hypothetical protein L195_g013936 [Trifolium pratense]|uniref:Uncharacterized protein n=1 Tax=Trifolium pratense TaxID=57577 RepID=A0A2K3PPH2_TRIPR|nr:hypothetical protein L195_g013936 [Trifolium pratense]
MESKFFVERRQRLVIATTIKSENKISFQTPVEGGGSGGDLPTSLGAMTVLVGERTLGCSMDVKLVET